MRYSLGPRPHSRSFSDTGESIAVNSVSAILPIMQCLDCFLPYTVRRLFFTTCLTCSFIGGFCVLPQTATAAPAALGLLEKVVTSYTITQRSELYKVNITYPRIGNPVADAELAIWARDQAVTFTQSVEQIPIPSPLPYELSITYETIIGSSRAVSIVFYISTSMEGTHPKRGMATFIYDKHDGRRLSFQTLFAQPDGLFNALSHECRASLTEQLGVRVDRKMLEAGTVPQDTSFDLFALTPGGLRIFFPPYQVAPDSEGYLSVAVPLANLAPFKPQQTFWDQ